MDAADLGAPSGGGGSGSGGSSPQVRSLKIAAATTELVPREELPLTVHVVPAGRHLVRFALPANDESQPLDAVLDRSEAETDETGTAGVVLLASSSRATFRVRASIDDVVAELELAVTDMGTATIVVQPTYSGRRDPMTWVASARRGNCAEGPVIPPPDGPFLGFAPKDHAPEIVGVPANTPVAITLRSGHYMGGCASVEMFPAGPEDRRHVVKVTVLDRPIELAASQLSLSLNLNATDTAFVELNQLAGAAASSAMLGSSSDDADALLDAMRATLDSNGREELDLARQDEGWDDLVRAHWGQGAPTRLRERVASWLGSGAEVLKGAGPLLQGELRAIDRSSAELRPAQLAGLTPEQAGLVNSALVSWSADADDTVVLGTDLYLSSSRLALGLAEGAAQLDFPEAESAAQALALALDCEALGGVLAGAGSDETNGYLECDADCLSELCQTAVTSIWQRGRDVSSAEPVRLALTAAGEARVGDAAEIAGIRGTWVGELSAEGFERSTGGPLSATQPAP